MEVVFAFWLILPYTTIYSFLYQSLEIHFLLIQFRLVLVTERFLWILGNGRQARGVPGGGTCAQDSKRTLG